jgi:hypothetical protein
MVLVAVYIIRYWWQLYNEVLVAVVYGAGHRGVGGEDLRWWEEQCMW